jgi:diguanylate cyclase (GGDEF)-like protein/PAS domain S-box-containing protein
MMKADFPTFLRRQEKPYLLPVAVLVLCGLSVLMVIWGNEIKGNQMDHLMAADTIMDMQLSVSLFAYEFEEHMYGEAAESVEKIRARLLNAERLADVLLEGGEMERGHLMAPLKDREMHLHLQAVQTLMRDLDAVSRQRLSHTVGSAEDKRLVGEFETIFRSLHETMKDLEVRIEESGLQNMRRSERIFWVVLSAWTVMIFSGGIGFWRHEKTRGTIQNALINNEEKYRSLVDSTEDSIYLVDRDYRYVFMNQKHLTRLGLTSDQYPGKKYSDFHTLEETEQFRARVGRVFLSGESFQHEHQSARDNRFFLQTLSPVKDEGGNVLAVTVVSKNITHRKVIEEELRAQSLTDELTGLYNRRGFFALAEQQLKVANRLKTGIYMLYADLNDLKVINDTFGHQEGDNALIEIANVLRDSFRESDIISRIGGDEFVVVPIETNGSGIDTVNVRLRNSLEERSRGKDRGYRLSVSIGIAYYDPHHPCTVSELLAEGDALMYEEKRKKPKESV